MTKPSRILISGGRNTCETAFPERWNGRKTYEAGSPDVGNVEKHVKQLLWSVGKGEKLVKQHFRNAGKVEKRVKQLLRAPERSKHSCDRMNLVDFALNYSDDKSFQYSQ